jgi:hypothetical protein
MPKRPKQPPEAHWALFFSRTILIGLVLGGGRIMQAISFSWSVVLVCGYLTALLLEILFEQRFRSKSWIRPLGIVSILVIFALFMFGFVYASDPLVIKARNLTGEKEVGTQIAGIIWRPEYSDFRILFENASDNDYHNLDFVLSTDRLITAEAETTKAQGVQVYNTSKSADAVTITNTSIEGKKSILPDNKVTFFTAGVRVTCEKLIKHGGAFEIILAIAQPLPAFKIPSNAFDSQGKLNPDFLMVEGGDMGAAYGPRINATKVCLKGSYESLGSRPRKLQNCYPIKNQ